ncbi:hypothetical protein [Leptothermofonsia sp. ETS-13]|uniref:hypothetical protein n=1 Tax=Leptothermofonsia sp. ETS-13 TaxID=3035696 RepID=UPI003B9E5D5D
MSQDASTSLLKPSQDAPSDSLLGEAYDVGAMSQSGGLSVESYADRLMDDLFEDVEEMLRNGLKPPSEPELPEASASRSPTSTLGLQLAEQFRKLENSVSDSHSDSLPDEFGQQATNSVPPKAISSGKESDPPPRSYDRLLLAVGCVSLLTTLALWLLVQEANRQAPVVSPPAQTTASVSIDADAQFAEYMQRSLQNIDQKTQPPGSPTPQIAAPLNPGLPTVTVPGNVSPGGLVGSHSTPTTANRTSPGLDRVYGSVYNLPQSLYPTKSFSSAPSVAPLPSLPSRTATAPISPPLPLQAPGVARTLVGVVDLGEQSAILVEVNGVAQRFRLGESIGSSGWTLVEVSKNQAIIRRNGEVRSVFIGQSF